MAPRLTPSQLQLLDVLRAGPMTEDQIEARLGVFPEELVLTCMKRGYVGWGDAPDGADEDDPILTITPLGKELLPSRRHMARRHLDEASA